MIVVGTNLVDAYFAARAGHEGIRAARTQYEAWLAIVSQAEWTTPEDVNGGRVVFNIKANDYRLIALVEYRAGVLAIRFFGSHEEYDRIDAETV